MGRFAFVVAVLVWGWRCNACTMVWAPVHVGPSFRVKVTNQGGPVKGLVLKINDEQFVTDAEGLVSFHKKPGSYFVSVDHDDGMGASVAIEVETGGPANLTVPLSWPTVAPILVSSLRGTLHFANPSEQPAPTVGVDVLDASPDGG